MTVPSLLVDARNFDAVAPALIEKIKSAELIGLDTETQDDARHDGLNRFCGYDAITRKKSPGKKLVFDMNRMVITGFSLYPDGDDQAYYVNLNHADVENRVPWEKAQCLLAAKSSNSNWIAHNAPFELTVFRKVYDLRLTEVICTLQMAVSAYGPDEYPVDKFIAAGMGGFRDLMPQLIKAARGYTGDKNKMSAELADVFSKIIAKESDADHSYNGFVNEVAYGYDLKKAVLSHFGYQMRTFAETLGDKAHMGQLTGQRVAAYGADDAYWAVRLYHFLLDYMMRNCPTAVQPFFEQENPMIYVYSDIWAEGLKVNKTAITDRRAVERHNAADALRRLRATVKSLLPFPADPNEKLTEYDKWYAKNPDNYRRKITAWAALPDSTDDFTQCMQASGAVSSAWARDAGYAESEGPNFTYYMTMRTLMYDLLQQKPIIYKGKTQSDGESRGMLIDRIKDGPGVELIKIIGELASIEQRMKLYLTPYEMLTDPETERMYPTVSSMLASRRMGMKTPNSMQLAKRGESTYIRGFYQADAPDHVVVSIDWSAIELVEIGDFSGDPTFAEAFSTIPHKDLHAGAAASCLAAVTLPKLTKELFKQLPVMTVEMVNDLIGHEILLNLKKEEMEPKKAYGYWRTEIGKGANFNYWYSGALSTVGERLGWTPDQMWTATEAYRAEFPVAEKWRVDTIHELQANGALTLPDGHRRVRFEATPIWEQFFRGKFQMIREVGFQYVLNDIVKAIRSRANNQGVNSLIQGSCATIAKRSIIRIRRALEELGWDERIVRFMLPIHDELVFSVHRDYVVAFIFLAKSIMCEHPDIIRTLKLDASPAVGKTFEPWNEKKAPKGQIELNEAPNILQLPVGQRLNDNQITQVVDYLMVA